MANGGGNGNGGIKIPRWFWQRGIQAIAFGAFSLGGVYLWELGQQGNTNRGMIEDAVESFSARLDRAEERSQEMRDTLREMRHTRSDLAILKEDVRNVEGGTTIMRAAQMEIVKEFLLQGKRIDRILDLPAMATPDNMKAIKMEVDGLLKLHGIDSAAIFGGAPEHPWASEKREMGPR